jgi:hypothetical protein
LRRRSVYGRSFLTAPRSANRPNEARQFKRSRQKGVPACDLEVANKVSDPNTERRRNLFQGSQGHALLAAFEPIHVSTVEAGELGKLILGDTLLFSRGLDIFRYDPLNIVLQRFSIGRILWRIVPV